MPDPLPRERYPLMIGIAAGTVVLVVIGVLTGLINPGNLALLIIVAVASPTSSSSSSADTERSRVFAFIPLFIASVAFWSLYQQQFTVLTIYSDQRLDRFIGGFEMPVPWVLSINPVFIIVLSGVFAAIWTKLGHRQPATPLKFAAGTMTMGLAFLLFLPFVGAGPALIGIVLVFTLADLGRALGDHPACAGGVPHPDGGAVLPLGVTGDGDLGRAGPVLHRRERRHLLRGSSAGSLSGLAPCLP